MVQPSERYLDRGDVRLHYSVAGEDNGSIPLLLTHGFSASSAMWEPNLTELAASRRVVTWDIRGHGQTEVPPRPDLYSQDVSVEDMAVVLDACGIQSAAVGGLSLGGYLSLAFYNRYPERVSALLLFDTGPGYRNDEGRRGWNNYAISQADRLESTGLEALGNSPEVRIGVHDPRSLALAARHILTQQGSQVIESLDSIEVPTLVLVGEKDTTFLKAAEYMASHIPGSKKVVLPGAGHAANIDQPAAFNEEVEDFLASVPG
ncbi:MAG TPA: alpha/beta fold hydrolase [Acidimicrobiales bacterium]|nr:alpha/beta fold hydrolase [Acidimicrobiales bacterium]